MKTDKLIVVGALVGLAWYLYTRSKGLTLLGEPANPMLPPAVNPSRQSLVTPSTSTGTWATNIFGAVSNAFRSIVDSLHAGPGSSTTLPAPSSTGIAPGDVRRLGLLVPADEPPPPSIGAGAGTSEDTSLDETLPMWQWVPPTTAVPSMPWTLDPVALGFDPNYIPPPPGVQ